MEKMEVVEKKAQVVGKAAAQDNGNAAVKDAEKIAAQKAAKAAAAKKFAEHQKERKELAREAALELKKAIAENPKVKFGEKLVKWADDVLAAGTSGGTGSFFNKVFGESPKVGDKVKLIDYMKVTLKGKADLDAYTKKWAEKGIIVKFVPGANMFESEYVIEKM